MYPSPQVRILTALTQVQLFFLLTLNRITSLLPYTHKRRLTKFKRISPDFQTLVL